MKIMISSVIFLGFLPDFQLNRFRVCMKIQTKNHNYVIIKKN